MATRKHLLALAKSKNLKGVSKLRKDELIELLENLSEEPYKKQASIQWVKEEKIGDKIKRRFKNLKQKVDILKKATQKVIPEKISETIEKSVKTGSDYLKSIWEKRKLLTDEGRKKVRKRFLDFNKKISNLWKEPEIEIKELNFLAGKKYIYKGLEDFLPNEFITANEKDIEDKLRKHPETKARLVLICEMFFVDIGTGKETKIEAKFYSNFQEIYEGSDFQEIISEMKERVLEKLDNFTAGKSNWRFGKIIELELAIEEMIHDNGVGKFILTPPEIAKKNATINMKKDGNECFKWCVTRGLFPQKIHPERVTNELIEQSKTLNWKGISFPTDMSGIDRFEKNNKVSINIIRFNNGKYEIHRKAKMKAKGMLIFF